MVASSNFGVSGRGYVQACELLGFWCARNTISIAQGRGHCKTTHEPNCERQHIQALVEKRFGQIEILRQQASGAPCCRDPFRFMADAATLPEQICDESQFWKASGEVCAFLDRGGQS